VSDPTDTPSVREPNEEPPGVEDREDPEGLLEGSSIRERAVDVMIGVREPATVAEPAGRADHDTGYCPAALERAYLRVRWFEIGDFGVRYPEQYGDGDRRGCRWDRHPNDHNTREQFHPPPDAATPGGNAALPDDWRAVLSVVLRELDARVEAFWD
jgi:hypothetical protein